MLTAHSHTAQTRPSRATIMAPTSAHQQEATAAQPHAGGGSGSAAADLLAPRERVEAFLDSLRAGGGYDVSAIRGLRVERAERGRVVCRVRVGPEHSNQYGTLHGAMIGRGRLHAHYGGRCHAYALAQLTAHDHGCGRGVPLRRAPRAGACPGARRPPGPPPLARRAATSGRRGRRRAPACAAPHTPGWLTPPRLPSTPRPQERWSTCSAPRWW